jgi:hypothetical protein
MPSAEGAGAGDRGDSLLELAGAMVYQGAGDVEPSDRGGRRVCGRLQAGEFRDPPGVAGEVR